MRGRPGAVCLLLLIFGWNGAECFPPIDLDDLDDLEVKGVDPSAGSVVVVPGYESCVFIKYPGMSIFGYNTAKVENVDETQCLDACLSSFEFVCRSVDFNPDSSTSGLTTTCWLSSEDKDSIPDSDDFSPNINTDHYERVCDDDDDWDDSWLEGSGWAP